MAFDPLQEDFLHIVLQSSSAKTSKGTPDQLRIADLFEQYRNDPDSLIASDTNRARHLVALATMQLDYEAPFYTDEEQAQQAIASAEKLLKQAFELDPKNLDAQRMLHALKSKAVSEHLDFLLNAEDQAQNQFDEAVTQVNTSSSIFEHDLAILHTRPALRWFASIAQKAFIAGRYQLSLDYCHKTLSLDPSDVADVKYIAMYAMVKLEYNLQDLMAFAKQYLDLDAPRCNAWLMIAAIAISYKNLNMDAARTFLEKLFETYPTAARVLRLQGELPSGIWHRVNVHPFSEDELIQALSEAMPLLQEGLGAPLSAPFALWLAMNPLVEAHLDENDLKEIEEITHRIQEGGN